MDHPVELLMVEVLHQTGVVVSIEEILLVDPCSHKLQRLFDFSLPQQLIHLLEDELKVGLDLQFSYFFSFCGGDMVGVVPEVIEEALEVEEVLDVEVDQFALHHRLDPLKEAVYSG